MNTLYTNERAYCFLSNGEKAELKAALKEGRVVYLRDKNVWAQRDYGGFASVSVYRITKPELTKPSIDWDHVEDWVTCLAKDDNEQVFFYENIPTRSHYCWYPHAEGRVVEIAGFKSFKPGNCIWSDSLVMRPLQ